MKQNRPRNPAAARDAGAAAADVRAIYDELAARPIDRNCTLRAECCHFKLTGRTPHLTAGEALVAARALRAAGRTTLAQPPDGSCPLLHPDTRRCMIYESRPFGCRTHFCKAAGGPVARAGVLDLIRRLESVDARLGGAGPRTLPVAIAAALKNLR
jgi:Fe-S-cluster containining protein